MDKAGFGKQIWRIVFTYIYLVKKSCFIIDNDVVAVKVGIYLWVCCYSIIEMIWLENGRNTNNLGSFKVYGFILFVSI